MKKLNLIIITALCTGMLQACQHNAKDSAQTADSINAATDTMKVDSANTDTSAKTAATTPDNDDAKFAVAAADAGHDRNCPKQSSPGYQHK